MDNRSDQFPEAVSVNDSRPVASAEVGVTHYATLDASPVTAQYATLQEAVPVFAQAAVVEEVAPVTPQFATMIEAPMVTIPDAPRMVLPESENAPETNKVADFVSSLPDMLEADFAAENNAEFIDLPNVEVNDEDAFITGENDDGSSIDALADERDMSGDEDKNMSGDENTNGDVMSSEKEEPDIAPKPRLEDSNIPHPVDSNETIITMGRKKGRTPFAPISRPKFSVDSEHRTDGRLPSLAPNVAIIARIPSPTNDEKNEIERNERSRLLAKRKMPSTILRLSTVTFAERNRNSEMVSSQYYDLPGPKKPQKVITWAEANNARPPLRCDMDGPTSCSYTPNNKPLNETNSPAWTFRPKCSIEKEGGGRTSWSKPWFMSPHVWLNKVDFHNDKTWPTPSQYPQKQLLGPKQRTFPEAPSFTLGTRKSTCLSKRGSENEPAPGSYDPESADNLTMRREPSFSHQFRRGGTVLWSFNEYNPGPAAYSPHVRKSRSTSFTIRGIRRETSHIYGPYAC